MNLILVVITVLLVCYVADRLLEEKHRALVCDMYNEQYGGDWYYDKVSGCYRDYMTDRKVAG